MRILLVGATGGTGRAVLAQALGQGYQVTALVRSPATLTLTSPALTVVEGNVLDALSVAQATADQEAVICALGLALRESRKPTTVYSAGTRNIVQAMVQHQVRRLVCITGVGAGDSRGHGSFLYNTIILPLLLREGYRDKTRQEEVIRASDRDWVIVRPGMLTDGPARGDYRVVAEGNYTATSIARADVAAFVVAQLTSDRYLRRTPAIFYKR